MTTAGGLSFPSSADGLGALSNAQLAGLIKTSPWAPDLHPNIKSIAHLMPKKEQVNFLAWHQYGVGSAASAKSALSTGELKYAAHIQKLAAKKSAVPNVPAPTGGTSAATNCAATLGSQLAQSTALSAPSQVLADFGEAAKAMALSGDFSELAKWKKLLGPDFPPGDEPAQLLADVLFPYLDKITDAVKTKTEVATAISDGIEDLTSGKVAMKAITAANDKMKYAAIEIDEHLSESGVAESVKTALKGLESAAGAARKDVLLAKNKLGEINFGLSGAGSNPLSYNSNVGKLAEIAEEGFPTDFLNVHQVQAYEDSVKDALTKVGFQVQSLDEIYTDAAVLADKLEQAYDVVAELADKSHFSLGLDVTISETFDTIKAAKAAHEAASAAVDLTNEVNAYLAKPAAELKKLAGAKTEELGLGKSLGASYMDKETIAKFLAKADADQDVIPEVEIAQAKYAEHKASQAAKKGVANSKVEDAKTPAWQAGADTADVTAKKDEALWDLLTGDPETAFYGPEVPGVAAPQVDLGMLEKDFHKPAQTEHVFSYQTNQPALAGGHRKATYLDEDGNTWLWKIADNDAVALGETSAHEVGWELGFDMADIRRADNWNVPRYGQSFKTGTVQKFHHGVKGDLNDIGIANLDADQIRQLQEHQVLDWLLSQHDTHGENLLVHADGHLMPIDKGQAWKFLGNDKLSVDYKPAGNFGEPVYNVLWKQVQAGTRTVDFDAIDDVLSRIEGMTEARFREIMLPYAEARAKATASLQFLPSNVRTAEQILQAMVDRKNGIRKDFTTFYQGIAKKSGTTWTPKWAKTAAKVAKGDKTAGVVTPITSELAKSIVDTKAAGKALHLAGEEITYGQALTWTEKAVDGSNILRLELRLEQQADARLAKLFKGYDATASSSGNGYTAASVDTHFPKLLNAAKTVSTHADDGAYNAGTIQAFEETQAQLKAIVTTYDPAKWTKLYNEGNAKLDEWAEAVAKHEQATEYLKMADLVQQAKLAGTKTPQGAVQAIDLDALKAKKLATPPKGAPVTVQVSEPAKLFSVDPKATSKLLPDMVPNPELNGYQRASMVRRDMSQVPDYSSRVSDRGWEATIKVDDTEVKIFYRSFDSTQSIPNRGHMDLEVLNWDGSEATLAKMLQAVNKLGVDTRLANETDEALSYWRVYSRSMKNTVEYASPTKGKGSYAKIRSTVDEIESAIKPGMDADSELAIYRAKWGETFGDDAVARAPERIVHTHDLLGNEIGYGHIERFDLPEDLGPYFRKDGKNLGLSHGLQSSNFTGKTMTDLPATGTQSELVRFGQYGKTSTTSAGADMQKGSGSGTFFSHGFSHWQSGKTVVISNPVANRRVSTYAFGRDTFGELAERTNGNWANPADWLARNASASMSGGNETILRGGASFADDVELVFVRSASQRDEVIKTLKDQGITEIRGLPVEQRILHVKTDSEAVKLTDKFFGDNPDLYKRSYTADVKTPKIPGPQTPDVKPKKVRAASKKVVTPADTASDAKAAKVVSNVDPTQGYTVAKGLDADAYFNIQDNLGEYTLNLPDTLHPTLYDHAQAVQQTLADSGVDVKVSDIALAFKDFEKANAVTFQMKGLGWGNEAQFNAMQVEEQFEAWVKGHLSTEGNLKALVSAQPDTDAAIKALLDTPANAVQQKLLAQQLGANDWAQVVEWMDDDEMPSYHSVNDGIEKLHELLKSKGVGPKTPPKDLIPFPEVKVSVPKLNPTAPGAAKLQKEGTVAYGYGAPTEIPKGAKVYGPGPDDEKIFGYKFGPTKVNVVFKDNGSGTKNVVAQLGDEWYLIAQAEAKGKVDKVMVLDWLVDLDWPGLI